jgi:hypothetical protein
VMFQTNVDSTSDRALPLLQVRSLTSLCKRMYGRMYVDVSISAVSMGRQLRSSLGTLQYTHGCYVERRIFKTRAMVVVIRRIASLPPIDSNKC